MNFRNVLSDYLETLPTSHKSLKGPLANQFTAYMSLKGPLETLTTSC